MSSIPRPSSGGGSTRRSGSSRSGGSIPRRGGPLRARLFLEATPGPHMPAEYDESIFINLRRQVHKLSAPECPSPAKVRLIHSLYQLLAFGEHQDEFVQAGGIEVLLRLVTTDWPEEGRFPSTRSVLDLQVEMFGGRAFHSVRRVSLGMLADLSAYRTYQGEMARCGLQHHLPYLLASVLRKYRHGQTYAEMYGRGRGAKHAQYMASRLVSICANLVQDGDAGPDVLQHCGEALIAAFDPFTPRDREGGEELGAPDIHDFLEDPADQDPLDHSYLGGADPFPEDWMRFVYNALAHASDGDVTKMVAAGVVGKMRAGALAPDPTPGRVERLAALETLEPAHERYCRRRTERVRFEDAARAKKSEDVRLRGNAHFQEGDVAAAEHCYTEALRLSSSDAASYSNRALCGLYRGRVADALADASRAVYLSPHRARCWARKGEVLLKCRQGDCALVCFRQAAHLAPLVDEYAGRVVEALALVAGVSRAEVGDVQALPRLSLENTRVWLRGLVKRRREAGQPVGEWKLRARAGKGRSRNGSSRGGGSGTSGECEVALAALGLAADQVDDGLSELLQLAWAREVAPQMPAVEGETWEITFSDTSRADRGTGQVIFEVRVVEQSAGTVVATYDTFGPPKAPAAILAVFRAMSYPLDPTQRLRPGRILVAHRLSPYYQEVADEVGRVGVSSTLETREEASSRAAREGGDPDGLDHPDMHAGLAEACANCGVGGTARVAGGGAGTGCREGKGARVGGGGSAAKGRREKVGNRVRCQRCMILTYCSEKCRRAHWGAGHRWSCSLVPVLNKAYGGGGASK